MKIPKSLQVLSGTTLLLFGLTQCGNNKDVNSEVGNVISPQNRIPVSKLGQNNINFIKRQYEGVMKNT